MRNDFAPSRSVLLGIVVRSEEHGLAFHAVFLLVNVILCAFGIPDGLLRLKSCINLVLNENAVQPIVRLEVKFDIGFSESAGHCVTTLAETCTLGKAQLLPDPPLELSRSIQL